MHVPLSGRPFLVGAGVEGSPELTSKEKTETDETRVKKPTCTKQTKKSQSPGRNCIEVAGWVGAGDFIGLK